MISKTFTVLTAFATAICLSVLCSHSYAESDNNSVKATEIIQITKAL